ncbi:MAG: TIGR00730 family Rossman fold protein [Archangiaceae bacterium]|nr:TIGR00730 family Rossman fold protein [Archangiaceae bacterium]
MPIRSITCFCGARDGARAEYRLAAKALGEAMAARGLQLVYGGGGHGMMGALADAVLGKGGTAVGVIPHGLSRAEFEHQHLSELYRVDSMHERKALMEQRADAFIALPGGFGTLDELFEIATWSQIGLHQKPVGLLDTLSYWDGLKVQIHRAIADGFVAKQLETLLVVDDDPVRLLERLIAHAPPPPVVVWKKG